MVFLFISPGLIDRSAEYHGQVQVNAHNDFAVVSEDILSKIAFPEIIARPVESVPIELRLHYRELLQPRVDGKLLPVQVKTRDYLFRSNFIAAGLESTMIGYPFHAFW